MNIFAIPPVCKSDWTMRPLAWSDLNIVSDWITDLASMGKLDGILILDQLRVDWAATRRLGFSADFLVLRNGDPVVHVTAYRTADQSGYRLFVFFNPSLEHNNSIWEQSMNEILGYFFLQPETLTIKISIGPTNKGQRRIVTQLGGRSTGQEGWYAVEHRNFKPLVNPSIRKLLPTPADPQINDDLDLNDPEVFCFIFRTYFPSLVQFANELFQDPLSSRNLAGETLFFLWAKRQTFSTIKDICFFLQITLQKHAFNYLSNKQENPDTGIYIMQKLPGKRSLPDCIEEQCTQFMKNSPA